MLYLPLPNGWCVRAALIHTGDRDRLSDPALTGDGTEASRPTYYFFTEARGDRVLWTGLRRYYMSNPVTAIFATVTGLFMLIEIELLLGNHGI